MLDVSINTLSVWLKLLYRMANFMREVVKFLSSAFRIGGHKYFPADDKELIYSFYICQLEKQQ